MLQKLIADAKAMEAEAVPRCAFPVQCPFQFSDFNDIEIFLGFPVIFSRPDPSFKGARVNHCGEL